MEIDGEIANAFLPAKKFSVKYRVSQKNVPLTLQGQIFIVKNPKLAKFSKSALCHA